MAVGFVNRLEKIDVKHDDRKRVSVSDAPLHLLGQKIHEPLPVEDSRQVVRNGEMQNLPFEIPLCGQIVLDSDKAVHRVFGVSDGNDDLVGVVERAVLLPVDDLLGPVSA